MRITFLGTGTSLGVPIISCKCIVCQSADPRDRRFRSSVLIEENNYNILIDVGPDFRQQAINAKIEKIDNILLTHEHRDHVAGLDDIRPFNFLTGKPIKIYCEERVIENVKKVFSYAFKKEKFDGLPEFNMIPIENKPFLMDQLNVTPIRLLHHKLPILGFRINDFAYLTDLSEITNEEMLKLKGLKILVVSGLRKETHLSHYTVSQAIELIHEMQPERGYITHIGHQLGLFEDISKELPENIYLAYDGLQLEC